MIGSDPFQSPVQVRGVKAVAAFPRIAALARTPMLPFAAQHTPVIEDVQNATENEKSNGLNQFEMSHTPGRSNIPTGGAHGEQVSPRAASKNRAIG
jgi:hypothetical protein